MVFLLSFLLQNCNVEKNSNLERNPYYHFNTGSLYSYYGIGNDIIKLTFTDFGKLFGSVIELTVPDSLSRAGVTGEATYDIIIDTELKLIRIHMTSLVLKDTLNNILSEYYKYDKSEKYCTNPRETDLFYDSFFRQIISTFQYKQIAALKDENIVGCKFIFK